VDDLHPRAGDGRDSLLVHFDMLVSCFHEVRVYQSGLWLRDGGTMQPTEREVGR
jgi:hypothetical protein